MDEFQKVMSDARRVCDVREHCEDCPLFKEHICHIGRLITIDDCDNIVKLEKIEAIVEQCSEEHPVKTNRMALQEVFPQYANSITSKCPKPYFTDCPGCEFLNAESKCVFWDAEYKGGDGDA